MQILPIDDSNLIPEITTIPEIFQLQEPVISVPPRIAKLFPTRSEGEDNSFININMIGGGAVGVNTIGLPGCENIAVLDDLYNFSYKVKITEIDTILTRTGHFTYIDDLNTYTLSLVDFSTGWCLTDYNGLTYFNNNQTPQGLFTGIQNLSVIYINE
jgi:hypothetical protein